MKAPNSIIASLVAVIFVCFLAPFGWFFYYCFPHWCEGNDSYIGFAGLIMLPLLAPLSFIGFPIIFSYLEKQPRTDRDKRNFILGLGVVAIGVIGVLSMMFQPPSIQEWIWVIAINGASIVASWFVYAHIRRSMDSLRH